MGEVNILPEKPCPVTKTRFLTNHKNKDGFVRFLGNYLKEQGIVCHFARDDADTLIVKVALVLSATSSVEIVADDTDILIMLVHLFEYKVWLLLNSRHHAPTNKH